MNDLTTYEKLPQSFYEREDVVQIAQDLIGKYLVTNIEGKITVGKIVETEAYCGRNDKACHAFLKRTKRTEIMYARGGHAYVYLCYGIHHLLNVVTNKDGLADAVWIRAVEPVINVDGMRDRRGAKITGKRLTGGPGMLSQAMGITTRLNGMDLLGDILWIGQQNSLPQIDIVSDVRIGIDYAEEDALLPWRFYEKDNRFVSKLKKN